MHIERKLENQRVCEWVRESERTIKCLFSLKRFAPSSSTISQWSSFEFSWFGRSELLLIEACKPQTHTHTSNIEKCIKAKCHMRHAFIFHSHWSHQSIYIYCTHPVCYLLLTHQVIAVWLMQCSWGASTTKLIYIRICSCFFRQAQ